VAEGIVCQNALADDFNNANARQENDMISHAKSQREAAAIT
jgi:hypothetical protein